MQKLLSAEQMRYCDNREIENGTSSYELMSRAGAAIAAVAVKDFNPQSTLVLATGGNNGGDGIIAGTVLLGKGYNVSVCFIGSNTTEETKKRIAEAENAGVEFVKEPIFSRYTLIIDALFGIGLNRAVEGYAADIIGQANSSLVPILAVDIPSGISADTGKAMGAYIRAEKTVCIEAYKYCFIKGKGINAAGEVILANIGIGTEDAGCINVICREDLSLIPKRQKDSNKGTYGRVLVVGGCVGMCGAPFLSAYAAYTSGAGLVEIFTPDENRSVLQALLPEAIVSAYDEKDVDIEKFRISLSLATVVIVGPGLGKSKTAEILVKEVLENSDCPIIADADALNIIAEKDFAYPTETPVIITPHPGEMSRLCYRDIPELKEESIAYADEYAKDNGVITVLKTARTVITDGDTVFVNMHGTPALAKGGSGDTLCGIIAGLLCNDMPPVYAASVGVYVHSAAGELAAGKMGELSPLARDVISQIPEVLKNK